MSRRAVAALSLLLAVACDGRASIADGPVAIDVTVAPPMRLSDLRILEWDAEAERILYNERVIPYELNTALFSDYALKARAIYVPEGEAMVYDVEQPFALPVGSAIVKTFYFPRDLRAPTENLTLIETRVLIHTPAGWEAWPYVWNEAQTDAVLDVGGESRAITLIDAEGESRTAAYVVPQRNQCGSCHERNVGDGGSRAMTPIGPAARHLNRAHDYGEGSANQLQRFVDLGMLEGLPPLAEVPAAFDFAPLDAPGAIDALDGAEVERAARDYLDVNCAHCHDAQGPQGITSQLFLNHENDVAFNLGVCKPPGSAGAGTGGLAFDVVPGDPDQSILVFRVETTQIGAMMPLLGRSLQHTTGAALVRRWVQGMEPVDCGMRD